MIWHKVKVLEIFNVECGATPSTTIKEYWDDGKIKWVTPKDLGKIQSVFISDTERKISLTGLNSCSTSLIPKSSIILSTRAPIGYLAILLTEMCFNQGCKALVPKSKDISSKFYYYYLKTLVDYLNSIGRGSTFKEISKSQISNLQIPLPPLNEQHRIVEKIEELFTKLDSAVTELKNVKKQLKRYRQSVLKSAFEGKLTEVKIDEYKNLDFYTELITKGASPKWQGISYVDDNSATLFVTSENVRDNYLDLTKEKYVEDSFNEKQKRSILKKGDVLFNIVGASIGRAAIFDVDIKANTNQAVSIIRLKDGLSQKYLAYFLNSESAKKKYMSWAVDVARANLSLKNVSDIPIPAVSIQEQQKIVEEIETRLSVADKIEEEIDKNLKKTEQLRQSILKKAFEGRLVSQDPNDEPAEKLLERIKKEKQKNDKK